MDRGEKYNCIQDARWIGLLGCLEGSSSDELNDDDKLAFVHHFVSLIDQAAEKRGLLIRPIVNMCVLSPPLVISKTEIDVMFDILADSVAYIEKHVQ